MYVCEFCGKECNTKKGLTQHVIRCKNNPDEKVQSRLKNTKSDKWYAAMRKMKETGNVSNQYLKAKELGLPKPEISEETRQKLSKAAKEQNKEMWTAEKRKQHSEIMKTVVEDNPDSYTKNNICGRVKNIKYNGVTLKGSWELKTAQWLDFQNIIWKNEPKSFPYIWNGKEHKYFPDFYLNDLNVYIEVKGYKTERDEAKWSQFPETLVVIDKKYIHKLDSLKIENFL